MCIQPQSRALVLYGTWTIISAVGLGPLINLNFAAVRFKPAEVHQENVAETIARISGKR